MLRKAHSTGMSVEDIGVCYETDRFIFCKFFFPFFLLSVWDGLLFHFTYLYSCPMMKVSILLYGLESEQTNCLECCLVYVV